MKANFKNPLANVKTNEIVTIIKAIFLLIGYILLTIGTIFFTINNDAVFFNSRAMKAIFAIILLLFPIFYLICFSLKSNKAAKYVGITLVIIDFAIFLYIVLAGLVIDYFQPLSLSTLSSVLMIVGVVLMIAGSIINILLNRNHFTTIVATSMILLLMISGIIWANTQDYKDFTNLKSSEQFIFKPNEEGYKTFRIPSLYAVNKNVLNEKQEMELTSDPIYAFAEGRINSSHDKGDIDLVYKVSKDQGKTWSKVKALLSFGDKIGKYGNATIVLNEQTGSLHLFFMKGAEADNYHYQSYHAELLINKDDLSLSVKPNSITDISLEKTGANESGGSDGVRSDTLMVGPGKGSYIDNGTEFGRIIMPCSNNKHSFVVYSDDDGKTWENLNVPNEIKSAGLGNECEAAYINGELIMVVRDNMPCATFHPEQYQRLSYSKDGGKTWYKKTVNTSLKAPICMSSIANYKDKLIITFPDDFYTRANLTIGISDDLGNTFKTIPLYKGAAGYSSVTVDSDGNIFVLAEVGKVNYNENLVFLSVDTEKL